MYIKLDTMRRPSLDVAIATKKHYNYMYPWAEFRWQKIRRNVIEIGVWLPFVLPIKGVAC